MPDAATDSRISAAVEKLDGCVERRRTEVHVALRHLELAMTGEFLNRPRRCPTHRQVRTEGVAKDVVEGFAFWGTTYLHASSWRHYLPRLIDYAFRHPDDPATVTEALVRSLRPPERYRPRFFRRFAWKLVW